MKYFVIFWLLAIIAIPISFILLVEQQWIWFSILFLFVCAARLDAVRISIRTGAWGNTPQACASKKLLAKYTTQKPTIVGRGWGYFLQRKWAGTSSVLSMRNFTGRRDDGCWAAGSTIKTVSQYFKKYNFTFPSHPSYDDITIGSWIAAGCHGSGGDAGGPSSSVLQYAEVVCFDTPHTSQSVRKVKSYKKIREIFDTKGHNCVITWIKFHKLWPNHTVQKSAFDVNTLDGAEQWLSKGAILRVLFVGAARDGMGIRWQMPYYNTEHMDPHCCSKCSTFIQADCCSACCGFREKYTNWNGLTTLREANRWCPTILPIETFITVVGGYKNFEIIFRVIEMTPTLLLNMVTQLREMHREIGGRTEIRYGTGVVFWDLSLQQSFERPYMLLQKLGVVRIALHLSKYNPEIYDVIPVVKVGTVYFNTQENITF